MPVQKLALVQALNRVRLPGADRSASALGLLLDVLLDEHDGVTLVVADHVGGAAGRPVPAEWVGALQEAAAAVPGVQRVQVERRPAGSVPPSLQQAAARQRPVVDLGRTRVVTVASGKGGVGKSTVTANLAVALAATGQRVAALDADIYGFSLPSLLGVREGPAVTPDRRLVPARSPAGVSVLSMDFFVSGNQAVIWTSCCSICHRAPGTSPWMCTRCCPPAPRSSSPRRIPWPPGWRCARDRWR
jgi:ATP-binding protein involved in chromosome partitioning